MTNKTKLLCVALLAGFSLSAGYAQEVVPASGGNASGSGGTANYSVGQVFYTNITGLQGSMDQGIQSISLTSQLLPVYLLNFSTTMYDNNSVLLKWQTAFEKDNDFFALERSTDGKEFKEFARVNGKGNSGSITHYQAFDYTPATGNNYYRLKQTDFNGNIAYSRINIVHIIHPSPVISIFPNPTTGTIFLQTDASVLKTYQVVTLHGIVLESKPITSGRMPVNISHLRPGTYLVNIIQQNITLQSFKITRK